MRDPDQIRTYHGIDMDPFFPRTEEIDIRDIAHSLSLICRANGHISHFYSVAQHCLNCEAEASARGYDARIRAFCLLHDATECYISDLIRPIKRRFPEYYEAESRLFSMICSKLIGDLPTEDEKQKISEIDDALLYHEFLKLSGAKFFDEEPELKAELSFGFEAFEDVRKRYTAHYYELLTQIGGREDG